MTQMIAWSGEWSIKNKHGSEIKVCSIVIASRHGIMQADFKVAADGSLDMQSAYEPGTWGGKKPGATMSNKLWEHAFVTSINKRCADTKQHELMTGRDVRGVRLARAMQRA